MMILMGIVFRVVLQLDDVSTIITNIVMIFIITVISSLKADYDNDSCNYNDAKFK